MSWLEASQPIRTERQDDVSLIIALDSLGSSPGERHALWNFVSAEHTRIEQAKADWRAGRFAPVPGDEFIPLPES